MKAFVSQQSLPKLSQRVHHVLHELCRLRDHGARRYERQADAAVVRQEAERCTCPSQATAGSHRQSNDPHVEQRAQAGCQDAGLHGDAHGKRTQGRSVGGVEQVGDSFAADGYGFLWESIGSGLSVIVQPVHGNALANSDRIRVGMQPGGTEGQTCGPGTLDTTIEVAMPRRFVSQ